MQRQDATYYAISHACSVNVVDDEPGTVCCVHIHERQKLNAEYDASASTGQENPSYSQSDPKLPKIESGANTCTSTPIWLVT